MSEKNKNGAVYRDVTDGKWYWTTMTADSRPVPVGPFRNREEARTDFRHVMGLTHDKEKSNDERSG